MSSAKASFPPLQLPRRPPTTTPPLPGLTPPTPPMQPPPPSDLATPAVDGLFCTRLEVTSSFTPDSSRREPPTYLRTQIKRHQYYYPDNCEVMAIRSYDTVGTVFLSGSRLHSRILGVHLLGKNTELGYYKSSIFSSRDGILVVFLLFTLGLFVFCHYYYAK